MKFNIRQMRDAITILSISLTSGLFALSWKDGGEFATTSGVGSLVTSCYDPAVGQIIATWNDGNGFLHYATFQNGIWTGFDAEVMASGAIHDDIFCCYNSTGSQVVATWGANVAMEPLGFGNFQNGSWSGFGTLPTTPTGVNPDAFPCHYDNGTNQVVTIWRDSSNFPHSASFNGTSWVDGGDFSATHVGGNQTLFSCYDPNLNMIVATWQDSNSHPHFATFSGTWTDQGTFLTVDGTQSDIFVCYFSGIGKVVATWQDTAGFPHYATFDGSWHEGGTFSTSAGVNSDILTCYDSAASLLVATWKDGSNNPHFATFNGTAWTDGGEFATSNGGVNGNNSTVFPSYDSSAGVVVATWEDHAGNPHYAYTYTSASSSTGRSFEHPSNRR